MTYYQDEHVLIRDMEPEDIESIVRGEIEQGWHATAEKYEMRQEDRKAGKAIAIAAEYDGHIVGYIHVYRPGATFGAFAGQGYPEIVDFGVLEKYRRKGIGNKLMDVAEEIASQYGDTVYLGVGLNNGYGSAQRMYVKRGYIPDGSGVWYGEEICPQYAPCCNDDDLVLYLSKKL